MTYDPTDLDPASGLIATVGDADQHSQIARLTRRLDQALDDIAELQGEALANVRGEARGLAYALTLCTCYTLDEVRAQAVLRMRWRTGEVERPDTPASAPPTRQPRRRRRS